MKVLIAVLLLAMVIGLMPVFASEVSAASPTDNSTIVNEQNTAAVPVFQITGENESGNISKIDLNGAAKPDTVVNVGNSTTSELVKANTTDIVSVQNVSNSTEVGTSVNSVKSGTSRELTDDEMKNIKGKGLGNDIWNAAVNVGNAVYSTVNHAINKIFEAPSGNYTKSNSVVEYYPNGKIKSNKTTTISGNIKIPYPHVP